MPHIPVKLVAIVTAGVLAGGGAVAASKGGHDHSSSSSFRAVLTGYEEVPAVSSTASGSVKVRLNRAQDALTWKLAYRDLEAPVQQAHIHFGQPGVNGGVSVFLCSNLPGAPASVQACPPAPARIVGVARAQDVVGPAAQGIAPGELDELLAAMRAGVTYVNVHSDAFPDGEARGQLRQRRH